MVDVGAKKVTQRVATAQSTVFMDPSTREQIEADQLKKGDVLTTAKIAGIQAAKRTSELIPMCHPLPISKVDIEFNWVSSNAIAVLATVAVSGKTGVEMEALTAASVAALTIYDMCKAIDREMVIADTKLLAKSGGKSGGWVRDA